MAKQEQLQISNMNDEGEEKSWIFVRKSGLTYESINKFGQVVVACALLYARKQNKWSILCVRARESRHV